MDLNEISVFLKVVQQGSFSGAARELGMPVSTVSHKVASLEERLGQDLLHRTTRKLQITPAGEAYFRRCLEGMASFEAAEAELAASKGEPSGLLRVTAPVEIGSNVMPGLISGFTAKHPKVRVEVILTDRRVDLVSEGVDLAIRAGELKDSSLIARRLGATYFALFASPAYLKAHGRPQHPRELARHRCLQFTALGTEEWKLNGPSGAYAAAVPGSVILNNLVALRTLVVMGDGIANLPSFLVDKELREKRLERVLPEWRSAFSPLHFVYPAQRFVTPKLSAFMDYAAGPLTAMFTPEGAKRWRG